MQMGHTRTRRKPRNFPLLGTMVEIIGMHHKDRSKTNSRKVNIGMTKITTTNTMMMV